MRYFLFLILFLGVHSLPAQSFSFIVDSLTDKNIQDLPKKDRKKFERLIQQRIESDVLTRIDTTNYKYAFITESICLSEKSYTITETYCDNNNSIPANYVKDLNVNDPIINYPTSFHRMLEARSIDLKKTKRNKNRQLKSTYRLQTMIDKTKNKVTVSIHLAPV